MPSSMKLELGAQSVRVCFFANDEVPLILGGYTKKHISRSRDPQNKLKHKKQFLHA
jgi:hypothetical protein